VEYSADIRLIQAKIADSSKNRLKYGWHLYYLFYLHFKTRNTNLIATKKLKGSENIFIFIYLFKIKLLSTIHLITFLLFLQQFLQQMYL